MKKVMILKGMANVMESISVYTFFIWFTLVIVLGTVVSDSPMYIRVYKVSHTSAAFDWYISPLEKEHLVNCEVNYGPISDPTHLEVLPNFFPERQTFHISDLVYNVSYHFFMVCLDRQGNRFASNRINFTTGVDVEEPKLVSSSLYQNNWNMDDFYPTSVSRSSKNRPSSSVILGAVCGIIGFLIINVTLIVAVRRCSQAHQRRRILEMQQAQQYNGILYIQDVEA